MSSGATTFWKMWHQFPPLPSPPQFPHFLSLFSASVPSIPFCFPSPTAARRFGGRASIPQQQTMYRRRLFHFSRFSAPLSFPSTFPWSFAPSPRPLPPLVPPLKPARSLGSAVNTPCTVVGSGYSPSQLRFCYILRGKTHRTPIVVWIFEAVIVITY